MKTIAYLIAVSIIALAGCTDVHYVEIEKIFHDTVTVKSFTDRHFSKTDTVEITVPIQSAKQQGDSIVYVHDSVTVYRIDSVFITTTTTLYDTVVLPISVPSDTVVKFWDQMVYSISEPAITYLNDFSTRATNAGLDIYIGGIVVYEVPLDIPAQSFQISNNYIVMVNSALDEDEMYLPLLREFSRHYLGQKYNSDPTSVLNPFLPPHQIRWSNRAQHEEEINQLFTITQ